jgi:hypothetical protein
MDTADEAMRGLAELFGGPMKGPGPHHRYELIRGESGALEFELCEFDRIFDAALAEVFGPSAQPTVWRFKLDPETALLRYQ